MRNEELAKQTKVVHKHEVKIKHRAKQKLHRSPTHFKKRCKSALHHNIQRKMPVTVSDLYPAPVNSDDLPVNVICSL